ncbi:MAG: M16 family metallopeptidase [Bradymonadia bacterium]
MQRKTILVTSLVLLLGCGGSSQPVKPGSADKAQEVKQPASGDGTSKAALDLSLQVQTWTLDNGLTVIFDRDSRLPVVAVEVRYLVGSSHERPGRSGFAHLFEHLMFQGSQNFDDEYFKPYEPIGGRVNGTTNVDRTNYYQRVPKEYLERVLWMESDRMQNLLPVLSQAKLDNQRSVVKNERRQSYEDRPYGMVWLRMFEALYPKGHPYDHTPIGSHEDLSAATLDDVKAFFKEYYVPRNAVLTLSGDFEIDEAKTLIKRYFGSIESGQRAARPLVKTSPKLDKTIHIVEPDEVKMPRIHMVWHTPRLYEKGDAELDVLSSILTQGKNARLYRPLVMEQKVAKDVSAFQVSMALGSFFVVQATVAPGRSLSELETSLTESLAAAFATPPTDDEMSRALNGWKKSFYGRLESVISRASLLSNYYHLADDANYLTKDLGRYATLSASDIHGVAKKYLTGNHLRIDVVPVAPKASKENAK